MQFENGFHTGEHHLRTLLRVPSGYNPTNAGLTPHTARLLFQRSRLLALGLMIEDEEGSWPWCTVLCPLKPDFLPASSNVSIVGKRFLELLSPDGLVRINTRVANTASRSLRQDYGDPVIAVLMGKDPEQQATEASQREPLYVGGLGIDLDSRDRVKLSGFILREKMLSSASGQGSKNQDGEPELEQEFSTIMKVTTSLGNCPKYLNKKTILPNEPQPIVHSTGISLAPEALELLQKADLFFISSSYDASHIAVNHRGGPPGFVRVAQNASPEVNSKGTGTTLVYPEYSGNRLYQTLGNLVVSPRAGLVFPDFDTGDALFLTGQTEIVVGNEANALLPRSNLAVKIHVHDARFVKNALAFRAENGEPSPYNPSVRYLKDERATAILHNEKDGKGIPITATLVSRVMLTPTIARFRFRVSNLEVCKWRAGQYVAIDFAEELSSGYSHMRDDDPQSLNDDLVRTFTISSAAPPISDSIRKNNSPATRNILDSGEFEITIRNVGKATSFLFRYNIRAGLELPLKGFGGSFSLKQDGDKSAKIVPFIAGGIGITPLLAQMVEIDVKKLRLYWTIKADDLGLVLDTFQRFPPLASSTLIFVSGLSQQDLPNIVDGGDHNEQKPTASASMSSTAQTTTERLLHLQTINNVRDLLPRRITALDLELEVNDPDLSHGPWYLCTGPALRKDILNWLQGREVVFEDFDY